MTEAEYRQWLRTTPEEHERRRNYNNRRNRQKGWLKLFREGYSTRIIATCYRRPEHEVYNGIAHERELEKKRTKKGDSRSCPLPCSGSKA